MIGSCPTQFSTGNDTRLCYYYDAHALSWSDAYHQCSIRTGNGTLIELFTSEQFRSLVNARIDEQTSFWLGANNIVSCKYKNIVVRQDQQQDIVDPFVRVLLIFRHK
jgi:hypothetical protein